MNQDTTTLGWRHAILSRLEEARPKDVATNTDRIRWLATHLDEYVDRWVGFTEHPAVSEGPPSQAFDSDQFAIIELAIELIGQEIPAQGLEGTVAARWDRLVYAHRDLQATRDLMRRNELRMASSDFLAYVSAIN